MKMRLPTDQEWDRLMNIVHENNKISHWEICFLGLPVPTKKASICLPLYAEDTTRPVFVIIGGFFPSLG